MLGWLGRMLREQARQTMAPGAPARTGGSAGVSLAPPVGEAISSTAVGPDGRGVELFILDTDYLGDEGFYLGDDPIDPEGIQI